MSEISPKPSTVSEAMDYFFKTPHFHAAILLLFFFFFCCFCLSTDTISDIKFLSRFEAGDYYKGLEKNEKFETSEERRESGARRVLGGPGSSPPHCISKCDRCTPCKAVHVTMPPGTRVTTEYYPEAWRCKCGNKLYIP